MIRRWWRRRDSPDEPSHEPDGPSLSHRRPTANLADQLVFTVEAQTAPSMHIVTVENRSGRTFRNIAVGLIQPEGQPQTHLDTRHSLNPGQRWEVEAPAGTRLVATFNDADGHVWRRADIYTDSTLTHSPTNCPSCGPRR